MRVSVIIPNYNYADYLPYAIDSLLNQNEKIDEIIVVDDGSTDNSREVLSGYGDKIIAIFKENGGQASAFNIGFARSTGDIVCLLDSDDVFFPDKVKLLKKLYTEHPETDWIFHNLSHIPSSEIASASYPRFTYTPMKEIDDCANMRNGHPGYIAPATSGLTFRREFIAPLFPLPVSGSIYISDHYIKFYAAAKGKGLDIVETLGGQIIHGRNLYTGQKAIATRAKIFTHTAYQLFLKLPEVKKFCTNLMAEALVCGKQAEVSSQIEEVAGKYLKTLSRTEFLKFRAKVALKLIARNVH